MQPVFQSATYAYNIEKLTENHILVIPKKRKESPMELPPLDAYILKYTLSFQEHYFYTWILAP